ncbi:MAG: hypothetical protein K6G40_00695 [Eubacterium sp.]|nr:hypothetical protein [Eubacterium sp.]
MRTEDLLDAIGDIDDDLLEETFKLKNKREKRKRARRGLYAVAASCAACVVAVVGISYSGILMMGSSNEECSDYALESEESKLASSGSTYDSEAADVYGYFLCNLSDYDAAIYTDEAVESDSEEMTFDEALLLLRETGAYWSIQTYSEDDTETAGKMIDYAYDSGYEDVLSNFNE